MQLNNISTLLLERAVWLACLIFAAPACAATVSSATETPPNIILILADDMS